MFWHSSYWFSRNLLIIFISVMRCRDTLVILLLIHMRKSIMIDGTVNCHTENFPDHCWGVGEQVMSALKIIILKLLLSSVKGYSRRWKKVLTKFIQCVQCLKCFSRGSQLPSHRKSSWHPDRPYWGQGKTSKLSQARWSQRSDLPKGRAQCSGPERRFGPDLSERRGVLPRRHGDRYRGWQVHFLWVSCKHSLKLGQILSFAFQYANIRENQAPPRSKRDLKIINNRPNLT